MRLTLVLGEAETDALMRRSAREDRPPRHQALRLIRQGLMQSGDLAPDARECDRVVHPEAPGSERGA